MRQVWIVDDDEDMSRAIGLMLKMLDCEVNSFRTARAAAQALLAGKAPKLMVLDLNMPEVSGLDLLEFLRRRPEWKDLPIIMLSSESADSMVDQALKMGADAYIMKPVTIQELERAMTTALQKRVGIK
jgi:DNA-binding response OmpR family regulator